MTLFNAIVSPNLQFSQLEGKLISRGGYTQILKRSGHNGLKTPAFD